MSAGKLVPADRDVSLMVGTGRCRSRATAAHARGETERIVKEFEIPAPVMGLAGEEPYYIEFWAPVNGELTFCWTNTSTRANAESLLREWKARSEVLAIFCGECPLGDGPVRCPHGAPGWPYSALERLRIMPAREAI